MMIDILQIIYRCGSKSFYVPK